MSNAPQDQPTGREWQVPVPEWVRDDLRKLESVDPLSASLGALRMAFEAFNRAPGLLGLPDENGKVQSDAAELRQRWMAASILLHETIGAVERHGHAVIASMRKIFGLD